MRRYKWHGVSAKADDKRLKEYIRRILARANPFPVRVKASGWEEFRKKIKEAGGKVYV